MSCQGPCSCCAPTRPARPPLRAEPAPAPTITFGFYTLPVGSDPVVVQSGVSPVLHYEVGFPLAASPVFGENVVVNMIPNGDPASGTIDNTDPLNPILTLNIPSPADGADGETPFTALTASFVQPAPGNTVTMTGEDVAWMALGEWIYIQGGGWYIVASNPLSATQIIIRNPGTAELTPYWGTPPSGSPWSNTWFMATNASTGATITPTGFDSQVQPSGPPAPRGPQGDSGLTPVVAITYTVPVSAPVSDAENLVLYFNAAPPNIPTIGRFYSWNGASWDGGPNFVAAGGTTTYSGAADPNVAPPAGAKLLDLYIQFTGGNAVYYQLTAPSTWSIIGTVALLGTTTITDTHTGGGSYTFAAENFSYIIDTDSDIDLLIDDTNYTGQGTWIFSIYNSDASPHDFNIGANLSSGIPTLPLAIPATSTAIVVLRRYATTGPAFVAVKMVIEQAYLPA